MPIFISIDETFDVNPAPPVAGFDETDPDMVRLADGGFAIAWALRDTSSSASSFFIQRFDAGGAPVGEAISFIDQGSDPSLAALPGGGFVVAWQAVPAGIQYTRFDAAGLQIGPVIPVAGGDSRNADVAILADGGWVIVWQSQEDAHHDIYAQRFSALGVAGPVTALTTDPPAGGQHEEPSVVGLADGSFAVTWTTNNGPGDLTAETSLWQNGVATPIAEDAIVASTQVALLPDGRLIVVWRAFSGLSTGQEDIFAAFVATDGAVSDPFQVNPADTIVSQVDPRVAVFADGRFVIAYTSIDDGVGTPNARIYDEDGNPLPGGTVEYTEVDVAGGDFLSLAILDGNHFALSWIATDGGNQVQGAIFEIGPEIMGTPGPDQLFGTPSGDAIFGLGGDDLIYGHGGNDRMTGGEGNDAYFIDSARDEVVEAAGQGNDAVYSAVSYVLAAGVSAETLSTNSHAASVTIDLTGNELGQILAGNAGANRLNGGGGADYMVGFGGNDTYIVDNAGDLVDEAGAGNSFDVVIASVSYTLVGGVQIDELRAFDPTGYSPIDLYGNSFAQLIVGNAAANTLYGRGGADILRGLEGNDTYLIDTAGTLVEEVGNQGNDAIYTGVSYALGGNVYVETLSTNNHAATVAIDLTGNGINQTLVGNQGANSLHGGGGVDELIGFGGNDTYFTDVAATLAWESAGGGNDALYTSVSYTLQAGTQIETLSTSNHGATVAINLNGNEIGQTIVGNAGANILDGKGGADYLLGFGGQDVFAFTTALGGGNVDTILDFSTVDDTIALDDAVFTGIGGLGALNANAFNTGSGAADASDRIIYDGNSGALYFDADGNGAGAAIQFATVGTGLTLSASDFMVI